MTGEVALCGRGCCYIRSSLFSRSPWEFMATVAATLMRSVLCSLLSPVLKWPKTVWSLVRCVLKSKSKMLSFFSQEKLLQIYFDAPNGMWNAIS